MVALAAAGRAQHDGRQVSAWAFLHAFLRTFRLSIASDKASTSHLLCPCTGCAVDHHVAVRRTASVVHAVATCRSSEQRWRGRLPQRPASHAGVGRLSAAGGGLARRQAHGGNASSLITAAAPVQPQQQGEAATLAGGVGGGSRGNRRRGAAWRAGGRAPRLPLLPARKCFLNKSGLCAPQRITARCRTLANSSASRLAVLLQICSAALAV